jgi:nucleoside-diphosphate-sugar epimerase
MRALVTGATGFIGGYVIDRLVRDRCVVTALVFPGTMSDLTHCRKVRPVVGTLNDKGALAQSTRNIDVVYHLAGLIWAKSASDLRAVNVAGTANLLAACVANGVGRFVFVSSASVYTPALRLCELPLTEAARLGPPEDSPFCDYGKSKIDAEATVLRYHRHHGLEYSILRPTVAYGKGRGPEWTAQERFLSQLLETPYMEVANERPWLPFQWVHVLDLAKAILLAGMIPGARNQIFTIAGNEVFNVSMLTTLMLELLRPRLSPMPYGQRRSATMFRTLLFDIGKARDVLKYRPSIDLRTGLSQMLEHMQEKGRACSSQKWRGTFNHDVVNY